MDRNNSIFEAIVYTFSSPHANLEMGMIDNRTVPVSSCVFGDSGLQAQIVKNVDCEIFFSEAPQINPKPATITGVICGHRVEEIEDPLMQKIRWFDKLVDESAKGKPMEKLRVASFGLKKLFKLLRRKDKGWSHFPKDTPK